MNPLQRDNATIGLAACILGFLIVPYLYIALGALVNFPFAFSLIMLPPLFVGSGFLFWRLLAKPTKVAPNILFFAGEGISWLAVWTFLFFVSRFTLLTDLERIGLFCTLFLFATASCVPFVVMRRTILEHRLRGLPSGVSIVVLILTMMLSGLMMIVYLARSPAFI